MVDAETAWTEEQLKASAESCLDGMEEVRRDAKIDADKHFNQSHYEQTRLNLLQQYPAIARVVLTSEKTANELEIFVCKGMPPVGDNSQYPHAPMPTNIHHRQGRLTASYDSAMGKFASCHVGDSVDNFYIEEIEKLFPHLDDEDVIDSRDTEFRGTDQVLTIKSLRQYLKGVAEQTGLSWLDMEDAPSEDLVVEGSVRRKKTSFRLEFTLVDKQQDKIFRESIDSRFILLGAPGTGKTTTMISRLRYWMGSDLQQTGNADSETTDLIQGALQKGMQRSWVLFVPTDLLKVYVRNAMDAHGIGHLHEQIHTWDEYSYQLGLKHFNIYANSSRSGFIRKNTNWLSSKAQNQPIKWYDAFEQFRSKLLMTRILNNINILVDSPRTDIQTIGTRLKTIAQRESATVLSVIGDFSSFDADLKKISDDAREYGRDTIKKLAYQCDKSIIGLQSLWLDLLQKEKAAKAETENDAEDNDDTAEETHKSQNPGDVLRSTLRSYVIAVARNKVPTKGRIAERYALLKKGLPSKDEASQIGTRLLEGQVAGRLRQIFKAWGSRMDNHYEAFRRKDMNADAPQWYKKKAFESNGLCQPELDLLILCRLRAYRAARDNRLVYRLYQNDIDEFINSYCKMMVFVDELTDFSPIQLAAMYQLAHPALRSFMACGDINQRLTNEGIRTREEIKWAVPVNDNEIIDLQTVYRQTKVLHDLGQRLLNFYDQPEVDQSVANDDVKDEGVRPALCENCGSVEQEAVWIAQRIEEVFRICQGDLPTIAIFVPKKEDVQVFADLLSNTRPIQNNSLRVEACPEGNAIASEVKIGVYPVDKIKGLEFEAVFFTGVDVLSESCGDKFAQYLYVGSTRAVQFFGATCINALPEKLSSIRDLFVTDWS